MDVGVEIFFLDPKRKEFQLLRYSQKAREWTEIARNRLWVVIPDYMDDYYPGRLGDNVSKTISSIERYIYTDGVEWLPVIQSRYRNLLSFCESCQRTR